MGYFADSDEKGNIIGFYTDDPTIGHDIPSTAIPITDEEWEDAVATNKKYLVENGALVLAPPPSEEELLDQAKANKKAELDAAYNQTLLNGFKVTISGVDHVLGWTTDDKTNLNATQTAIDRGFWQFPLYYSDINGDPLLLSSQADLDIIEQTASKFFPNQHQQILTLKANVQNATTVDEVNAIVWTEAVY